ncbi:hypothetical protein FQR65_LT19212 [Abscondita terminalis]|nr:hypothetical protein FQR65_LT19212 [Abscondita terminalis]
MREFAKISSEFWTSPMGKKIKTCELETKVVAFYLMTCRHTNMLGIYYLPLALASHEVGMAIEGVRRGIEALVKVGFCSYDEENEYVWAHETAASQLGALKKNDNRVKHANRVFKNLPKLSFLSKFYEKYCDFLHLEATIFSYPKESPFEALEIIDGRLDIRDERLEKRNIPIIFCEEHKKAARIKNQVDEDEEKLSVKNLITFPVKTKTPVTFSVPLRQGSTRMITETELDEWQTNYPGVDVRQEVRQLIAWNQANPDRQKTERGINRHIQGWLAHAQQKQNNSRAIQSPISTWDHNMAVINQLLEEDNGKVQRALSELLKNPDIKKHPYFPLPADVVEIIEGDVQSKSLLAWTEVVRAIHQIGHYDSVMFTDKLIHAVIQDTGGWIQLCQHTEKELLFVQRDFERRYQVYCRRRPRILPNQLTGRLAHQNAVNRHEKYIPIAIEFSDNGKNKSLMTGDKK